jgi:hypothetical protein
MLFEWDPEKALSNLKKHSVSFEEKRFALLAPDMRLCLKGKNMKKISKTNADELLPEYDFDYSKAVRGKYCQRLLKEGSNVVVLEPDIAESFRNSTAVNEALRSLLELTQSTKRLIKRPAERVKKS